MTDGDADDLFSDDAPASKLAYEMIKEEIDGGTFTPEKGTLTVLTALAHVEKDVLRLLGDVNDVLTGHQEIISDHNESLSALAEALSNSSNEEDES